MSVPTPISSGKSGKANWGFFGRQGGISKKPYDSLNVAYHVKDNEADVLKNRETNSDL
jgi:copper oxidase (laccase) domain-containing protein